MPATARHPVRPPYDQAGSTNEVPRGLLFLSYQASIRKQFEVVNSKWMNNPSAPEGNNGTDLLVGQLNGPGGARQRTAVFVNTEGQTTPVVALSNWIVPTGGGYFFSPSLAALRLLTEG
jgi:hypothetical protein